MDLYMDGFNPSGMNYEQESMTGCYMAPIGLHPRLRSSSSSVRVITLTRTDKICEEILKYIVDDIIIGTTEGFKCIDANGIEITLFLDVVLFVSDYLEAAKVVDVMGHRSNYPCTACIFYKKKQGQESQYGHTVMINSKRMAFSRYDQRSFIIRKSGVAEKHEKEIGSNPGSEKVFELYPISYLSKRLDQVQNNIPLIDQNVPVVSGFFDSYKNNAVAPDHLLAGLAKNILNICFNVLEHTSSKGKAEKMICSALSFNGLPKERSIYSMNNKSLHSMSMSSTFAILLVSSKIFPLFSQGERSAMKGEAFALLSLLKGLVSLTYWWPNAKIDGKSYVDDLLKDGRQKYYAHLQTKSKHYIEKVNAFCKKYKDFGKELDKPNLHRLLELYISSIPLFGHVRNFSELVFEHFHQSLKSRIRQKTHLDKHITAVEAVLFEDWLGRLHNALEMATIQGNANSSSQIYLILRRLLLGEEGTRISSTKSAEEIFLSEVSAKIQKLVSNKVFRNLSLLGVVPFDSKHHIYDYKWYPYGKDLMENYTQELAVAKKALKEVYSNSSREIEDISFMSFFGARLISSNEKYCKRAYPYNHILRGSVIYFLSNMELSGNILLSSCDGKGEYKYMVITNIVGCSTKDPWVVGYLLKSEHDYFVRDSKFGIVKLTDCIRRAGTIHLCENSCKINASSNEIHCKSILEYGKYIILKRIDGYPPHLG